MTDTLDIEMLIEPEATARDIANKWQHWVNIRQGWSDEKKELRNYVFATDTRTTSNRTLPWSNSTTTPKLTQIYDNLKANYSAALFPNSHWMRWEADDEEGLNKDKAEIVEAYLENKMRQGGFEGTVDRLIDDFVLYGNCFATVVFEQEYNETDLEVIPGFIGPRLIRISPFDIAFNPLASSFQKSPKIIRSLVSVGDLVKDGKHAEHIKRILGNRHTVGSSSQTQKGDAFIADGFSSIEQYYASEYVELLTFYGDIYDKDTGEVHTNRRIVVMDRAYIVEDEPIASWLGHSPIYHAGWRSRPDNLYAMGPLDNLVGMQYRIDHLENLKADVFDQIALPILRIRGDVEDFDFEPGARIYMGDEGDVLPLVPDSTALNADLQIRVLEDKMEEMAGAPRQAMGIRTPGEKTAFEVQSLQNAAGRIFQHKAAKFEREFLEPVLNAMLESARRNMDVEDVIRVIDKENGAILFDSITKEDITAKGKIIPEGARHFAERAQRVQNINNMVMLQQDPKIGVHISGKVIARILAHELGEDDLFKENVGVTEQAKTQKATLDAEADLQEEMQIAAEEGL